MQTKDYFAESEARKTLGFNRWLAFIAILLAIGTGFGLSGLVQSKTSATQAAATGQTQDGFTATPSFQQDFGFEKAGTPPFGSTFFKSDPETFEDTPEFHTEESFDSNDSGESASEGKKTSWLSVEPPTAQIAWTTGTWYPMVPPWWTPATRTAWNEARWSPTWTGTNDSRHEWSTPWDGTDPTLAVGQGTTLWSWRPSGTYTNSQWHLS